MIRRMRSDPPPGAFVAMTSTGLSGRQAVVAACAPAPKTTAMPTEIARAKGFTITILLFVTFVSRREPGLTLNERAACSGLVRRVRCIQHAQVRFPFRSLLLVW